MFAKVFVLGGILLLPLLSPAQEIIGFREMRWALGLDRVSLPPRTQTLRIAILDKAFHGIEKEIGRTLPRHTRYSPGPLEAPSDFKSNHGVRMAQIVSGLITENMRHPDRLSLFLYNTFGFTNFKAAIDDLIRKRVDVVLYSEVWELGGNIDGRGFINREISKATRNGILWVNAAGNFGLTTFNSPIRTSHEDWVHLPDDHGALRVICKSSKCKIKIVLSWNDFKEDSEEGTGKDLDFALVDRSLKVVQVGALKQSRDRREERPGHSKYPREAIQATIRGGSYFVRVKNMSRNFSAYDRLRITVDTNEGEVAVPSAQPMESLLVPADHPDVLTVGAIDSNRSGTSVSLRKPEIMAASSVRMNSGDEFRGTSNSAALTAAFAGWMKLAGMRLSKEAILRRSTPYSWNHGGLHLQMLRFGPRDGNCFGEGDWSEAPPHVHRILLRGGRLVATTAGWRVMIPYDPILLEPGLRRIAMDDLVLSTPEGLRVYPRRSSVPPRSVEIFQRPMEIGLCQTPQPAMGLFLGL